MERKTVSFVTMKAYNTWRALQPAGTIIHHVHVKNIMLDFTNLLSSNQDMIEVVYSFIGPDDAIAP